MKYRASVIGVGRLGLCWALNLERNGYDVLGVDINEDYVNSLNNKTFQSPEPNVSDYLANANNFKATVCLEDALEHANIIYIVVATNTLEDGHYDHSIIDGIIDSIENFGKSETRKHIILQSTTIPGYCDSIEGRLNSVNYSLSYNPEFIRQGSIIQDQQRPDMILIGNNELEGLRHLTKAYDSMCTNQPRFNIMDNLSAEITKLALNCFLTTKISFTNMVGDLAMKVGADPDAILQAISSDSRVGSKLMKYGYGYGGTCLPRDNRALAAFAKKQDMPLDISVATDNINRLHLEFQVSEFVKSNQSNEVQLHDVSFKPGSDIIEESQKLAFGEKLAKLGYSVTIFDTQVVLDKVNEKYGSLFNYEARRENT